LGIAPSPAVVSRPYLTGFGSLRVFWPIGLLKDRTNAPVVRVADGPRLLQKSKTPLFSERGSSNRKWLYPYPVPSAGVSSASDMQSFTGWFRQLTEYENDLPPRSAVGRLLKCCRVILTVFSCNSRHNTPRRVNAQVKNETIFGKESGPELSPGAWPSPNLIPLASAYAGLNVRRHLTRGNPGCPAPRCIVLGPVPYCAR